MYTPVQDIVNWIANHPTAQTNCSIVIRYSPFDNYPDYITSVANGVTADIDPGRGLRSRRRRHPLRPRLGADPRTMNRHGKPSRLLS